MVTYYLEQDLGALQTLKLGPDGYLYVLTFQDEGSIFRIVPEDFDDDTDGTEGEGKCCLLMPLQMTQTGQKEKGGNVPTDDTGDSSMSQILVERITRDVLNQ